MHARRADIERQFEAGRAQFDEAQREDRGAHRAQPHPRDPDRPRVRRVAAAQPARDQRAVHARSRRSSSASRATSSRRPCARPATTCRASRRSSPRWSPCPLAYYGGAGGPVAGRARRHRCSSSLWRLAEQAVPAAPRRRGALLRDLAAGAFVQVYVTFLARFAVVLTAAEGGQWWTLAFIIVVVAADTGAYASGLMFGKHKMAPSSARRRPGRASRAAPRPSLVAGVLLVDAHARQHVVVRPHVRRRDLPHRHARRPRGVAHQARPRHQGHELLAARATAGSSTGSTRSCRLRRVAFVAFLVFG